MNKSSRKFSILIFFSIVILIMPILSINTFFFNNKVLWIFKSKENAYQYLQFIGTFLGVIITVVGAFIAIEHQMEKEKQLQEKIMKQQKEMDIQINLREDFTKRILETRKSIYNLESYSLSIDMVSETVIRSEKTKNKDLLFGFEELSTNARNHFNNAYEKYSDNISDLITQTENYNNKLKYIDYDYNILKEKYSAVLDLYYKINMRISAFPNYTLPMMECINTEIKEFNLKTSDLTKELIKIFEELNKYYKIFDI